MDNVLAQQLQALGQDMRLRKQNLLNLIPCLTQQEVRDLTARLSEVDFRTDIVARLPLELRVNIAGQFGYIDVFPLLNVSRQWRAIWLQPDILGILSQQCRYLDDDILNDEAVGRSQADRTAFQYELIRRRRRRFLGRFSSAIVVRHNVGGGHDWLGRGLDLVGVFPQRPISASDPRDVFSRTEAPPLEHREVRSSLYKAGRLAWLSESLPAPDNTLIVVEDLNTRTKRIYQNASVSQYGRYMALKALGDKLLVAGTSRVMFIWHLESNKCSQVFLPQQPTCCVTHGEHVAFLRPDGALLWKSGSELTALNIDPVLERNQQIANTWPNTASSITMGVFFHPFEEGALYITVCFTEIRQVAVHKFTAAGYSGAQEINLRDIPELSRLNFGKISDNLGPGGTTACWEIRPVNSSGDFLVDEWRTTYSGASFNQGHTPGKVRISGLTFIGVRFNVRTGDFSLVEKSLPSGSWSDMYVPHLSTRSLLPSWNDQMVFALQATQNRRNIGGAGSVETACWDLALVVMSLWQSSTADSDGQIHGLRTPSSQHLQLALCAPRSITVDLHLGENNLDLSPAQSLTLVTEEDKAYGLKPESHSFHASTELLKSLYSKSDFILDLTPILSLSENGGPIEGPHHIFQDDDFIILFHRHGYIAWDFRTDGSSVRT